MCLILGRLVLPLARAQQKLLLAQSEISFVSRQMGSPVAGRFRSFDAQVSLDPKQLAAAKIVLVVDLASATLGSPTTLTPALSRTAGEGANASSPVAGERARVRVAVRGSAGPMWRLQKHAPLDAACGAAALATDT